MATPKSVQKTPPTSPAIAPQQSPRKIAHSLSFPLTLHSKTSSTHASITSKFSHLKEKILSGPIALAQPTTSAIKRSVSLRNTARRLSSGSLKHQPEMAVTIPGRRKGVTYAIELTDTPTVLTSDSCATTDAAGSAESAAPGKDKLAKLANNPNPSYIPIELINGLTMMRITHKKRRLREFKINPITFELSWDSKSSSRCSIDFIEDIREGEEAKYYRESLKVSSSLSSRWATILYNFQKDNRSKPRLLHVVAQSMEDFRLFIGTLKRLAIYRQAISRVPGLLHEELLEDWTKYASPVSKIQEEECVTIDGVQKILHKFYIYCSDAYLKAKFHEVNANRSGFLTFSEFERLVQLLKMRPEVEEIFHQNADMSFPTSAQQGISREGLLTFCRDMQKMHESEGSPTIDRIFERFSIIEEGVKGVTVEGFSQLLLSETYMPFVSTPVEDLTRPLTDYFISSSHNTYLVGRQLAGESSIEPYIKVLDDSCRCLEIDCWDGDDGPIVNHGRTFTSSVSFESVIEAINYYAFRASSLPVILSLEVHCNIENQSKMVDIMLKTFGDKLVTKPLKENETSVPSPLELRNRILIKVKASNHQKSATGGIFGTSVQSRGSTGTLNSFASSSSTTTTTSTPTTTTTTTDGSEKEDDINKVISSKRLQEKEIERTRKDAAKRNISEKLGSLGVYFQGIKFRNFALPVSKTYNHVFSLSELKINAMIKDASAHGQLVKHNKRYFLRVYPSGYRVTSTNFDPICYWKRGVQMVSLNWQTYGKD
jgi:phosphatidylinositol phospholipase C delta